MHNTFAIFPTDNMKRKITRFYVKTNQKHVSGHCWENSLDQSVSLEIFDDQIGDRSVIQLIN